VKSSAKLGAPTRGKSGLTSEELALRGCSIGLNEWRLLPRFTKKRFLTTIFLRRLIAPPVIRLLTFTVLVWSKALQLPRSGNPDLHPSDECLSPWTPDPGGPALRSFIPFLLNLDSMKRLLLSPYSPGTTAGSGALFGEDRYPITVFLALTLFTTISNNMGSLPL